MSSSPPALTGIDPRVRRTRQQLGQAFLEVMNEKGFQALSVQDITERAGVNRTTFYLHFPDKYALADFSVGQAFRQEVEKRLPDMERLTLANLRGLIYLVFEFVAQANAHCAVAEPQFEALVEAQVRQQIQAVLRLWLQSRPHPKNVDTTTIAASWAIYGLALHWHHDKKRAAMEKQVDGVLPLIAAILGLAA